MHRLQELVRLHRLGDRGARAIARQLRMSPNTERSYRRALDAAGLLHGPVDDLPELATLKAAVARKAPPQEASSVEPWRRQISEKLDSKAGPKAIYDWLRTNEPDFEGSYDAVKRLCRRLRRDRGPEPGDVAIPVDTAPGQVAQVDFGHVGRLLDPETGKHRRAWVFVMVLGHSRHLFARVVFDQKSTTWLRLHVEAFAFFGGAPAVVVPDNLKAAVIRAAFGMSDDVSLNRSYCELARHYGLRIDPTPAYAPEKKGKVERAVQYVKRSFFLAWGPTDLAEANAGLVKWNAEVASVRVHGTTRRVPLEVFTAEEKPALLPLPSMPYDVVTWSRAMVHRDAHIAFDRRLYSVPWTLMGRRVWVRATSTTVAVYADDERVATHDRRGPSSRSTVDAHLPEGRRDLAHRSQEHWELRARAMGEDVHALVTAVFASDDVLLQLRRVQAIVTHLETFPPVRARAACRRALRYGNLTYVGVRDILRKGLDLAEAQDELPLFGRLDTPTFARPPSDFTH